MPRKPHLFILDEAGQPVGMFDALEWAAWYEANDEHCVVEQTQFSDGCMVSTIFLGIDHDFSMTGVPVLWETMTFGGPHGEDAVQLRYRSREEAEQGHADIVAAHGGL